MAYRARFLLLVSAVAGCGDATVAVPEADRAHALQISSATQLIAGPKASGRVGDFLLTNGRVRFIISAAGRTRGWFPVGGSVIDADRVRASGGDDRLQEMVTRLGTLRVLYSDTVEIAADGSDGKDAVVRVTGHDIAVPLLQSIAPMPPSDVHAVTEYRLAPWAESLEMVTTVTDGSGAARTVQVGDMLVLGDFVSLFAPTIGTDRDQLVTATNMRYVAAFGGQVSYGYFAPGKKISMIVPQAEIFGIASERLSLAASGTGSFTRRLAVGERDVAALLPEIVRREGGDPAKLPVLTGSIHEKDTGAALGGAVMQLSDADGPYSVVVSDDKGAFAASLEAGHYDHQVLAPAGTGDSGSIDVTAGAAPSPVDLRVAPTGRAAFQIKDGDGQPSPARIRIASKAGASFGERLSADGSEGAALPPGDYHAVISRGYEWEAADLPFTVAAGATVTVAATIRRVVDTHGFIAIDSHTHTAASVDSQLDPKERVAQALADGVELVITTDHDVLFDLAPTVKELGITGPLATALGCEVSPVLGHINGFPLVAGPMADTDGYWPVKFWSEDAQHDYASLGWPADIFKGFRSKLGATIVQLNHPRSGQGVLNWVGYDTRKGISSVDPTHFDMNWDAIEVCNAGCSSDANSEDGRTLRDFFSFINQGFRKTAVGVSDAHSSGPMLGRARTMVEVMNDDPLHLSADDVFTSLRAGRAVVLDGAFAVASIKDDGGVAKSMGELARVAGPKVTLHVTVQAPPWIPTDRIRVFQDGLGVQSVAVPAGMGPTRFDGDIVLDAPAGDASYVVIVESDSDMSPVLPGSKPRTITNPVYLDRDGNGKFDAPGL